MGEVRGGPGAGGYLTPSETVTIAEMELSSGESMHSQGWARQMPSSPGGGWAPCESEKAHSAVRIAKNEIPLSAWGLVSCKGVQDRVSTTQGDRTHVPALPLSNSTTLGRWLSLLEL